ncbi:AsmA-like C-terminal region-containing protein [Rubritalea spongiae]|uniref:AsmA-like C-terminal region-containing protein n=1 Tax=Rubritalea spongiae TaxID=430797 RepID=A0ABW5E5A6_9BACT
MSFRHFIIRLRVLFTILIFTGIVGVVSGFFYLHEKGFSHEAADRVAAEMERYGIFAEFDNLSFHLIHGLTANNVIFYRTEAREIEIASLPTLAIHVDKTKIMRGTLKITNISIEGANLAIPLVTELPNSPVIQINNVTGSIDLPGRQSVSTTDLTGTYQGIQISLSCNVWRDKPKAQNKTTKHEKLARIKQYNQFLKRLEDWKWPEHAPPKLSLFIEGNLSRSEKVDFDFVFESSQLEYKNYPMEQVLVEGDWNQSLITVDHLSFINQAEQLKLTADYDIIQQGGRYNFKSSIHLQNFFQKVFDKRILPQFQAIGTTRIQAEGTYNLPKTPETELDIQLIGKVESNDFNFLGATVNNLKSDFSWNNGDLYLDAIQLQHDLGELSGRLIVKDRLIRYDMISSLPAHVYFPFIKQQQLRDYLSKITFTEKSYIDVHSQGSLNQDNLREWNSHGHAELRNFKKNGVPISYATGKYNLDRSSATFSDITATFDYANYPLKLAYSGPNSGTLTAKSLHFDWPKKLANIEQIRGSAYPVPVLNLFAPHIGEHLEQYRFHLPPSLTSSGKVQWQKGTSNQTDLTIDFTTAGTTDYNFLKEDIPLENVRASVRVLPNKVEINQLAGKAMSGSLNGYIHVIPSNSAYLGKLTGSNARLSDISKVYGIKGLNQGSISGNFQFNGRGSDISSLNGIGKLALKNGDLMAVPLFGPLSKLVDGVLSNAARRDTLLHEKATDLDCTFTTKNGVFYTNDLNSMTTSTVFTGEGWINCVDQTIDLTIRMNYRGLMGLAEVPMKIIELPVQALNKIFTGRDVEGLRQFHGTGKLSKPDWQFTPFQAPRDGKRNPLFSQPSNR